MHDLLVKTQSKNIGSNTNHFNTTESDQMSRVDFCFMENFSFMLPSFYIQMIFESANLKF